MTVGSWTLRMSPVGSAAHAAPWPAAGPPERKSNSAVRRTLRRAEGRFAWWYFKNLDFMFICRLNEQTQQAPREFEFVTVRRAGSTPARAFCSSLPPVAVRSYPILEHSSRRTY